jgi:hypothetical protein
MLHRVFKRSVRLEIKIMAPFFYMFTSQNTLQLSSIIKHANSKSTAFVANMMIWKLEYPHCISLYSFQSGRFHFQRLGLEIKYTMTKKQPFR